MKRKALYSLLLLVSISCQKNDELSIDFRAVITEYQNQVPLPSIKNKDSEKYLYVVNFEKKGNDTLFNLIRCPGISKFDSISGIYQDKTLKPLAIIDNDKLGKNSYYQIRKKDVNDFVVNEFSSREDFPPLYRYRIKNKKIVLIQIDTISDNWKK